MKQIIIRRNEAGNCYTAQFVGDDRVKALFGTDTLQTPFTLMASADMVVDDIQRLNPGCLVVDQTVRD